MISLFRLLTDALAASATRRRSASFRRSFRATRSSGSRSKKVVCFTLDHFHGVAPLWGPDLTPRAAKWLLNEVHNPLLMARRMDITGGGYIRGLRK